VEVSAIIRELRTFYKDDVAYRDLDRHLTEADVDRWSSVFGWPRSQVFEAIAKLLALGFNNSELSFEFCDAVVNDLSVVVTNTSGPRPQLFGMSIQHSTKASTTMTTIEMRTLWRFIPVR
jgi:hypothetical protein